MSARRPSSTPLTRHWTVCHFLSYTFNCAPNYVYWPNDTVAITVQCGAAGVWNTAMSSIGCVGHIIILQQNELTFEFIAILATCTAIQSVQNGSVNLIGNTSTALGGVAVAGSQVTFSCDVGYSLDAANTTTCLANGEWSNSAPACQRMRQ